MVQLDHFRLAVGLLPALPAADPDDPGAAGTDAAGVARHALDPVAAERLWEVSERMDR